MIARAELPERPAGGRTLRKVLAREHVVEPPPDVALAQVAPGRPPGEEFVVLGIECATDVDDAAGENGLEQRALLRSLADPVLLALLGVHVALGARHVEVAAQEQPATRLVDRVDVVGHRPQERGFAREVLAAVGHVYGSYDEIVEHRVHDAGFRVEVRMGEGGLLRPARASEVEGDARVAAAAVPAAPEVVERGDGRRDLSGRGLDLLQADDVGAIAFDPLEHLVLSGADAVHVPGHDLHGDRLLTGAAGPGHAS